MDYSERLDAIMLAPIRRLLHPAIKCTAKAADNLTLFAEYRVLPSYLIRLLHTFTHDIRLRQKTDTNTAATLHKVRMTMLPRPSEQEWLQRWRLMLKWTDPMRLDDTTEPNWEEKLDNALYRHVFDIHSTYQLRSYNATQHYNLVAL
jgi:hypothetical protein